MLSINCTADRNQNSGTSLKHNGKYIIKARSNYIILDRKIAMLVVPRSDTNNYQLTYELLCTASLHFCLNNEYITDK